LSKLPGVTHVISLIVIGSVSHFVDEHNW
jgi:hypothetical protein